MLAVEKWAAGRSFFIALLAPQMASSAQEMHTAFRTIKERRLGDHLFPLPHLPDWFRMYRSHHRIEGFLRLLFAQFSPFGQEGVDLWQEFKMYQQNQSKVLAPVISTPSAKEIEQAKRQLNNLLSASFTDLQTDFDNTPVNQVDKDNFWKLFDAMELELSFYFLVTSPCWLLYRTSPAKLYRSARQGDFKSIDMLLRLDPLMIHDPLIGKRIQEFRFNRKRNNYEELIKAPLSKPKKSIARKKVKYAFAGFISAISHLLKQPLTEPEIRSLFDAVSQDAGKGSIDTDLPDSPEAFYMAIKRDRDFWLQSLDPNKKM